MIIVAVLVSYPYSAFFVTALLAWFTYGHVTFGNAYSTAADIFSTSYTNFSFLFAGQYASRSVLVWDFGAILSCFLGIPSNIFWVRLKMRQFTAIFKKCSIPASYESSVYAVAIFCMKRPISVLIIYIQLQLSDALKVLVLWRNMACRKPSPLNVNGFFIVYELVSIPQLASISTAILVRPRRTWRSVTFTECLHKDDGTHLLFPPDVTTASDACRVCRTCSVLIFFNIKSWLRKDMNFYKGLLGRQHSF